MKKLFALFFLVCLTGFLAAPYALANKEEPKTNFILNEVVKSTDVMILNQMESPTFIQAVVDVGKENKDFIFNDLRFENQPYAIPIQPEYWRSEYNQVSHSNPSFKEDDNSLDKERYK